MLPLIALVTTWLVTALSLLYYVTRVLRTPLKPAPLKQSPVTVESDLCKSALDFHPRPIRQSPETVKAQHQFRDLTTEHLKKIAELKNGVAEEESVADELGRLYKLLCEDLGLRFGSSRAAEGTAMSMCCTAVMQLDGLDLIQWCGVKFPERCGKQAQQLVETLVPNIWSL